VEKPLKIGEAAAAAGVRIQTLRYYEDRGLLASPGRTEGGFRLFGQDTIRRVRFIKRAQALGFTLEEVAELLALGDSTGGTCGSVKPLVERKLASVEEKIEQLSRLRISLVEIRDTCPGKLAALAECPILGSLDEDDER
jgi:MerR family copper efflux transcriptional regulator